MPLFADDIAVFRKYVPVTSNFKNSLGALLPYLENTAEDILGQFLGDAICQQLIGFAGNGLDADPLSDLQTRALDLTRRAIGGICTAKRLPLLEIQMGGDGVTVSAADGRKPAYEYQTKKAQAELADGGWAALDKLISLVAKNETEFPDWPDSPYYQEHQDSLFKSAADFSRYYGIQDRWLTFWALRPWIGPVEEDRGAAVKARIDAITASPANQGAIDLLHRKLLRAVAYQAVIEAIPNLSIELNGSNIQVNYAGQFGNTTYFQAPTREHLDWVLFNLQKQTDIAWNAIESGITALSLVPTAETDSDPGWLNDDDSKLIAL